MSIEIIKEGGEWDRFIDESPHGMIFHKWNFLKNIEKYSAYQLNTYGIYDDNGLNGLVPLFYKQMKGLKMIFSPPPRTAVPYLGLVVQREYDEMSQKKKESYLNFCVDEISNEISKFNPNYISIITTPNFIDVRPFLWNKYSIDLGFTYVIDLTKPIEEIWNNFHRYIKKDIRHAEKKGLRFQAGDDISKFYDMQKERYEEKNLRNPIINESYVEEVFKAYPNNLKVYYVVNNEDEILGAISIQEYKDRFMTWIGTTKSLEHANEYLTWKLIQIAKEKSYKKFELTGAGVKNLCQFKSKFNPSLEVCYSIQKSDIFGKLGEWMYLNLLRKTRI